MATQTFRIWRGQGGQGQFVDYQTEVSEGMVVLDAVHAVQATQANDLACRWNCKAGKCGSCSAEINGLPRLMCLLAQPIPARRFLEDPAGEAGELIRHQAEASCARGRNRA